MNFINNLFGNNHGNNHDNNRRRSAPRQHNPFRHNNGNNERNNNHNSNPHQSGQSRNSSNPNQSPSNNRNNSQNYNEQYGFNIPAGMEQFVSQFIPESFFQEMNNTAQQQYHHHQQQQHHQQQHESNAPPPASDKAIRTLPKVMVTPEDLVDENNRECCICFEENKLGDKVSRLPCAHIFHPHCITEWLNKHCTCPICRYELETSNPIYESNRLKRMSTRKPRFAKYELSRMKTTDLKNLCTQKLKIPIVGSGYTKQEIIELIMNSGKIEIINAPKPVRMVSVHLLREMGVGKLKRSMMDAGVFFDARDVIEKEDMVQIFINSGRVVFDEEENEEDDDMEEQEQVDFDQVKRPRIDGGNDFDMNQQQQIPPQQQEDLNENHDDNKVMVEDASDSSSMEQQSPNQDAEILLSSASIENLPSHDTIPSSYHYDQQQQDRESSHHEDELNYEPNQQQLQDIPESITSYSTNESADISSRSVSELKQLAQTFGVDLSNCLEKREMIDLIVKKLNSSDVGTQ